MAKKTGNEIVAAFQRIFNSSNGRVPEKLQTDKGLEFFNKEFKKFLKQKNIKHFAAESDMKASIAERFNRSLKERMWRYFTAQNTRRFVEVLPKLVNAYNHSFHRTIGMCPADVRAKHEKGIWIRMFGNLPIPQKRIKFSPGDSVRMTRKKGDFEKGYMGHWTEEQFKVKEHKPLGRSIYNLTDKAGEDILGPFYVEELQKVDTSRYKYRIERIISHRKINGKKEILVKWTGWPYKFNTWILEKDQRLYNVQR